jgi:hypothetical protein
MLFAFDKDDGRVIALASPEEIPAHCKAVDIQDGYWLFFDDDGSPLEPRFAPPDPDDDADAGPGDYTLDRAMSGRWLQERLGQITSVRGCGLASFGDLDETLRINRGKRVLAQRPGN